MLVEFSVKNFRSFREKQTFQMTKSEQSNGNSKPINPKNYSDLKVNRSAVVYGPNASGKSNLLNGLWMLKILVEESATNLQTDNELPFASFKFDKKFVAKPCEFEIAFIFGGALYQFGLTVTPQRIQEEWLDVYNDEKPLKLYSRKLDKNKRSYKWHISKQLGRESAIWKNMTRHNSLFLSTACQFGCKPLLPAYRWFSKNLVISPYDEWNPFSNPRIFESKYKPDILNFLSCADISINDFMLTPDGKQIYMSHANVNGENAWLDFNQESHGTQRLFCMASHIVDMLRNGRVFIVDEIESGLHPLIQKFIINSFQNNYKKNSQVVFTTHNVNLLNSGIFDHDQIWFCDMDKYQSTLLTSLFDFEVVEGVTNTELAYLKGRYGCIPVVRPLI